MKRLIEAIDVCAVLKENAAFEELAAEKLLPVCERALQFAAGRLKPNVTVGDDRLLALAAALARFDLFCLLLSETERFTSYKAGDITIQKNLQQEVAFERSLRDEALANAADILTDGGFHFAAT